MIETFTLRRDDPTFQAAAEKLARSFEQSGSTATRAQIEAALWRWFTIEAEELLTDAEWYADSPHSNHSNRFSRCLDNVRTLAPEGDGDAGN